jgi:hypothetical protein
MERKEFRRIYFLNLVFFLNTEVLTHRITFSADRMVDEIESPFVKGRYILDSAGILHETIHYMHEKGSLES